MEKYGNESEDSRGRKVTLYTYSEARQKLATLLEQAMKEGEVRIKRKDGQTFVIRPEKRAGSPLDIEGIPLAITTAEIVQFVREGRKSYDVSPQDSTAPEQGDQKAGSSSG